MTSTQPSPPTVQPHDRVTLDGGTTNYEVVAVSRAGQDAYLREVVETLGNGSWVAITSITTINGKAVR